MASLLYNAGTERYAGFRHEMNQKLVITLAPTWGGAAVGGIQSQSLLRTGRE